MDQRIITPINHFLAKYDPHIITICTFLFSAFFPFFLFFETLLCPYFRIQSSTSRLMLGTVKWQVWADMVERCEEQCWASLPPVLPARPPPRTPHQCLSQSWRDTTPPRTPLQCHFQSWWDTSYTSLGWSHQGETVTLFGDKKISGEEGSEGSSGF